MSIRTGKQWNAHLIYGYSHICSNQFVLLGHMKTPTTLGLSFFLILATGCGPHVQQEKDKSDFGYIVNNSFAFDLPMKADTAETLLGMIQGINPNILFMRLLEFTPGEKKIPLIVSCYTGRSPIDLDTAFFVYTVDFPSQGFDGYQSLPQSHSRYEKDGQTFYRKVSCMNGQVVNVMYYAMKNNRDRSMYELKMSGPVKDSTAIMDFLEGVMAGSAFVD